MAELKLRAQSYRRERGRLIAIVVALLDGNPLHADTVVLDSADQRAAFSGAVRERLNGNGAIADDLDTRLLQLRLETASADEQASVTETESRSSQADKLIQLAVDTQLFHDPQGDCYLRVPLNDHRECWPTRARGFRRWLAGQFWLRHEKAPSADALNNALNVLDAQAQFAGPCWPVYLRVAPAEGGLYVDLGDPTWRGVRVTAHGWEVVAQPPVCFRRAAGMRSLPIPERGGHLDALRTFINLEDDDDWALLRAWLVAALRDRGPYPVLGLHGQQGTAKTTVARMLRALIDPAVPDLRSDPREVRDLAIAARNCWIVAFDNVSHVQPWLSDAICRLATGGGWATRELYSDLEEVLFDARRPVLLTGITEYLSRGRSARSRATDHLAPDPLAAPEARAGALGGIRGHPSAPLRRPPR